MSARTSASRELWRRPRDDARQSMSSDGQIPVGADHRGVQEAAPLTSSEREALVLELGMNHDIERAVGGEPERLDTGTAERRVNVAKRNAAVSRPEALVKEPLARVASRAQPGGRAHHGPDR